MNDRNNGQGHGLGKLSTWEHSVDAGRRLGGTGWNSTVYEYHDESKKLLSIPQRPILRAKRITRNNISLPDLVSSASTICYPAESK